MDSIKRIKEFIAKNFPEWVKIDFSIYNEEIDFRRDLSELYKINNEEIILISYTNISITGTDRVKPQLRVFLDEYKKPFYFAKKHQLRFYLFSIFTKEDKMARGLDSFNPKEYIISIETNLDVEGSRRDLRSIYDYANEKLNGRKYLKCTRANYRADINQASFIYIGTPEVPEKDIFENFINYFDSRPYLNSVNDTNNLYLSNLESKTVLKGHPYQQIYYGAPGTGKSYVTNNVVADYPETIRTTFHPDSDYSTFVGAYKPTNTTEEKYGLDSVGNTVAIGIEKDSSDNVIPIKEKKIEYKFVKQAFLKAYIKAWNLFKDSCVDGQEMSPQFLVIEEINRGNCAQIFGDLFQLLDRKNGFSEYPIEADEDIQKALLEDKPEDGLSFGEKGLQLTPEQIIYINTQFDKEGQPSQKVAEKISLGQVLVLPPNFYIWATMNTSDQSLFPIDSAFKRRWDWKYVRICEGKKKDGSPLIYRIRFTIPEIDGKPAEIVDEKWWDFVKAINKQIEEATKSEDKKLGFFFCKPDKKAAEADDCNTIISAETFVGKVVFYLWQDVFKDYGFKSDIFKKGDKKISFHDFYPEDMVADEETNPEGIDLALVKTFIYKVLDKKENNTSEAPVEA